MAFLSTILTNLILINSSFLVILILNQNEDTRDFSNQNTKSLINPLERLTWISLFLQFVFLLIQIKITEI